MQIILSNQVKETHNPRKEFLFNIAGKVEILSPGLCVLTLELKNPCTPLSAALASSHHVNVISQDPAIAFKIIRQTPRSNSDVVVNRQRQVEKIDIEALIRGRNFISNWAQVFFSSLKS